MAGNMLNDHLGATYYTALLECISIRRASEQLPEWTSYNEETTWCAYLFQLNPLEMIYFALIYFALAIASNIWNPSQLMLFQ